MLSYISSSAASQLVFPACVVNGAAVSKTFQILYRNEEVTLNDVILFKAHVVVDSKKQNNAIKLLLKSESIFTEKAKFKNVDNIRPLWNGGSQKTPRSVIPSPLQVVPTMSQRPEPPETQFPDVITEESDDKYKLETEFLLQQQIPCEVFENCAGKATQIEESLQKADFQLIVELWFTEQTFGPDQHNSIQCVSSRALKLHLCPLKGLHHHLPVLFDYFHLSSVSITVHGCLLAIHQPYVNLSRQGKAAWLTSSPKVGNRFHSSTSLESVLFGNTVLKPSPSLTRLSQARCIHRNICTLLLSSYESLQAKLLEYMKLLPPWQQLDIEVTDCYSKLEKLREITKALEAEDELLAVVNSDIAQLCAENIILWQQFLEAFTLKDRIQQHLAREHHLQRVKRFAEGFFVIENSRQSIFHCAEQSYQTYLTISDSIRKTKYFAMLPSLGVECIEMDGSYETLPVIFEDHYQDLTKHKNSCCRNSNKSKGPMVSVNDINLTIESEEVAKLHKKGALSDTEARASKLTTSKSSSHRQREGPKKEKNVGCFGGITPKSSVSSEELRQSGNKGSLKGSSSVDKSIKAIQQTEPSTNCSRPQPKNSFSVEELARIKEDYKMRVLESKLYKVVPDMPPPANKIQNPMSQAYKQELFRGRNSKSLSAVEEFRGHVKLQSTRTTAIPRLETVPVLAPIWRMEPRRPPRLEELRNQKSKLDVSILKLEIPKLTLGNSPSSRLQPEEIPQTTINFSKSTKMESVNEKTKETSQEREKEGFESSIMTSSSVCIPPSIDKTHSCGSQFDCASDSVVTLSETKAEEKEVAASKIEENTKLVSNGSNVAPLTKENIVVQPKEIMSDSQNCQTPSLSLTVGDQSDDEKYSSSECKAELKDFRTKLSDMTLDLTSVNNSYQKGCHTPQKMSSKFRRRLNGFQFLPTMKSHSPAGSTSSDSVVLMGYKKLEQSESLPVELSSIGRMAAMVTKRNAVNSEVGIKREMSASQKRRQKSLHPSHVASSMPNMTVLEVDPGEDRSLIASESMPDLGGDSATHDDLSVISIQNDKGSRNCQWSSSDSFVVAPRATAEESDDEVDDDTTSDVGVDGESEAFRERKCSENAPVSNHRLELPIVELPETSPVAEYNKLDEKCQRDLPGGSTKIASTTMMDLIDLKKLCNTSPGSSSTSESYGMRPYRSPSPSSSSTSERSGWVSSQLSSSDSSSSEGTKGSTSSSPVPLQKRQHSHSDFSSLRTKSSAAGDEDGMLLSSTEDDKHIYEEIHLPPEEFRDPPSLPLDSITHPTLDYRSRASMSSNLIGTAQTLLQEHRFKQHGHHHHHHMTNYRGRHVNSTDIRDSNQSIFTTHCAHKQLTHSSLGPQSHQRLASSSSRETGYSSDRPTSKEDTRTEVPGVHRSRPRASNPPNVSRCHQDRDKPKSGRGKRRQNITATYLETKCTIFEMFTDTTFRGYVGSDGRRWVPASDSLNDAEDDEDDEAAKVPAPPPPPALRGRITETKVGGCDLRSRPCSAKEIEGRRNDKESKNTLVSMVGHNTVKGIPDVTDHLCCSFVKAKEEFKKQLNLPAFLYSDSPMLASTIPYFHVSEDFRLTSNEGLHLVICVHGLDGNSADLRLVKTYLELGLPCSNLEFLMSERNQGDTFSDFEKMTDKLVAEIIYHIEVYRIAPSKISFIGHSLGNIIIRSALVRPQMKPLLGKLHTFLSLSGPHLGTLYNSSGLVNMGLWFMQKWKKSGSLLQLSMKDATDIRRTFLYRLSQKPGLEHFRNILLFGSSQDRYVPIHSARIELCKAATKDTSIQGAAYRDMVHGLLQPVARDPSITFIRYDVHHALPNTANSLIGRAAHIAVLDSELFIEKFLTVCGLKYFK